MKNVKDSRFPASLFVVYFCVLLLMSGIHTGLIVLGNTEEWNNLTQTLIPMVYWAVIAAGLTLYTRRAMRITYEEPMHRLAEAAGQVAKGDFSVYVPALHTPDKLDYLDVMIMDFNKMVEELGSIETLKTDFVSNVSHEMKTPIAIIKNYAELLQMKHLPEEEQKDYGKSIEEAAVRLSDLISNILKLNKLENQAIAPELEVCDVCRQLCDCVLQYEEVWEAKDIELEVDMDDTAFVMADRNLLELVWNNLISNAIKFSERGGNIVIRQICTGERILVSITDQGCGMDKESMNHIFDKFYQGDTSHSGEGNGLGLALVKRVLELLDGDIQVVSRVREGSTFTVSLPAAKPAEDKGKYHG